jgi:hypothetical protein
MKSKSLLLAASLLLPLSALSALAAAPPDDEEVLLDDEGEPVKRNFDALTPGKTSTRTVLNTVGKGHRDYEGRVVQGEMDVLISKSVDGKDDPLLVQRAKQQGKGLSYVHVLEYDEKQGRVMLVFKDDILWYAVYPTRAGETKLDEVSRRFGDAPKMASQRRKIENKEHTARISWFPDSGVGFVQLDGAESYGYKVVFEPKAKRPAP